MTKIETLEAGSAGLLLDFVRIEEGPVPPPPEQAWANLAEVPDSRGGRALVNGGFDSPLENPASDNPWGGTAGALEEFYAIGLREPYRMTYNSVADRFGIGDVGAGAWEEVNVMDAPAPPPSASVARRMRMATAFTIHGSSHSPPISARSAPFWTATATA